MSKMTFKSNLWKRQNRLFSISCKEKSFRADTFSVYLQTSKYMHSITDGFCAFTGTRRLLPVRIHEISSEALPLNIIDHDVMYENTDAWSDNSGDVQNQREKKNPSLLVWRKTIFTPEKLLNHSDIRFRSHKAEYSLRSKSYSAPSSLHNRALNDYDIISSHSLNARLFSWVFYQSSAVPNYTNKLSIQR